jgi:hypothetical protein
MTNASNAAPLGAAKVRKMALQMVGGAVVGGVATFGLLSFVGKSRFDLDDPARLVALAVGLVFALIGLFVALGVLAPKPGAHLLNVENEEELREQRGQLGRAALVILLLGGAVLALALSRVGDSRGLFSAGLAAAIAAGCFVALAIFSFVGRNDHDELMKSVSREAMTWAMYGVTVVLGVWGAAAHLGFARWISPLGAINALLIVQLVAIFAVSAKRGLLRPR